MDVKTRIQMTTDAENAVNKAIMNLGLKRPRIFKITLMCTDARAEEIQQELKKMFSI